MGDFGWEYIDVDSLTSASGPTGSVMYRVGDMGSKSAISGSDNLMFHTASNLFAITGNVEISGTLTANQYNINVVDKTVTNISSSGDTIFGDTSDDIHQFTGSVYVKGPLSASDGLFGSSLRSSGGLDATGSVKAKSFISSSGEIFGTGLRTSGDIDLSGSISGSTMNVFAANITTSGRILATGSLSSSGEVFGYTLRTSGDTNITGTMTSNKVRTGDLSSSARIFGHGLETSGDVGVSGSIRNAGFVSASGEIFAAGGLRTSGQLNVTGTIKNKSFISSSGEVYGTSLRTSGDLNISGSIKTPSFISSSGEVFAGGGLRTSGDLAVSGTTDFKGIVKITGSLELTGSGQSLLVLNTQDADTLKEIVFKKAGSAAAAIQINSNEHLFIENENAKDIIFRTNNQNTLRVYGANQRVGINQVGPPSGTLDVNGDTVVTGSFTVSGSVSLGNTLSNDVIFVSGALTASKGIQLNENSFVKADKNLVFGNSGESVILYNTAQNALILSGSQAGGIALSGSKLVVDVAGGAVISGALGGPGSYLGLAAGTNQIILTSSAVIPGGNDTHIQFNKDGVFSGSDNLQFDYDDNELSLCGTFEVKSGSSPASAPIVFEVDGEDGIIGGRARGKIIQTYTCNFDLTNASHAAAGRYLPLTQNGISTIGTGFNNDTAILTPFSGKLTNIMYRFPGTNNASEIFFQLEEAPITENGTIANSTTRNVIVQATSSVNPGVNVVGGIDILRAANVTGSNAFTTGSLLGIFLVIPGGTDLPGQAHFTAVFEFNHRDEYVSGSGN